MLLLPLVRYLAYGIHEILRPNDEGGMNQRDIIANARVLLLAGSETTATLLSGATYYLLQHPDAMRHVQSEVRTAFKREEEITLRSVSSTSSLPYLNAVIQESLRCYPPVPATLPRRTGPEGALIDGRFVPANVRSSSLLLSLVIHITYTDFGRCSSVVRISQ